MAEYQTIYSMSSDSPIYVKTKIGATVPTASVPPGIRLYASIWGTLARTPEDPLEDYRHYSAFCQRYDLAIMEYTKYVYYHAEYGRTGKIDGS